MGLAVPACVPVGRDRRYAGWVTSKSVDALIARADTRPLAPTRPGRRLKLNTYGWAFREQYVADHGIDAQVEVDGLDAPTGRYINIKIKCGSTYFCSAARAAATPGAFLAGLWLVSWDGTHPAHAEHCVWGV
jgi:hypothetical protein